MESYSNPTKGEKKEQKATLVNQNFQGSDYIAVGRVVNAAPVPTHNAQVYYQ